jgi:hypothetical protein
MLSGVGILWALFDRERLFLQDRLAGTCIVRVENRSQAALTAEDAEEKQGRGNGSEP